MLPPPSPPRGHITHLLEQTLHKVAIWAGLRKRQISDKPGSAADRQAGRQVGWAGSSEAGATLTCQLAGGSASQQVCALSQVPPPSTWKPPRPSCCGSQESSEPSALV